MPTPEGILTLASHYPVAETLDRLEKILREKNVTVFARVDHSGEAAKVGMEMRPTELLIFGNPKGGTPLMQAVQLSAIDLPLKALAWQDAEGKVWLSYNDPLYLGQRFSLPHEILAPIAGVVPLLEAAVR